MTMSANRKVLFYDDFSGDAIDLTKWNIEEDTESEKGRGKRYTCRPENICVEDGMLKLTARRENFKGGQYTSGSISTKDKFSFRYGRLEMRAKLPYGEGVWPAFWTLGDDYCTRSDEDGWPYAGEIDVMEFIGVGSEEQRNDVHGTQSYGCEVYRDGRIGNNRSTCNLHWGKDRAHHESCGASYCLPSGIFADDFHVFAVEWTEEKIVWFVDDTQIHEMDICREEMVDAFHKPHWIIMNLGIVEGWGPEVKDITPFPQTYYVDYVKVLAPEEVSE